MKSETATSLAATKAVTSELSPLWGVFPSFHFEKVCASLSRHWVPGKTTVQACVQRRGIMLWQRSHSSSREEGKSSGSFFHAAPSLDFLLHLWDFIEHRTLEITPQNSIDIFSEVLEYTGHTF